ncbi:MAG TPA: EF-Tu/IF-2/RF-3 family GTPase [Burkholderiales bacterium]|nr:EF-Tu/IF-2/RF-3 family GTPase [Burkholderiales bacterium]
MAAAKRKPKAKAKPKKAPAAKPAIRKKAKPLKKKAAAPAKKPAARQAAPKKQPAARPAPKPRPAAPQPERRDPLQGEERVGFVTHYYGHLSVAAIRLESGSLSVGDTIRILGHTSDFRQRVVSMQIEHQPVTEAGKRQEIGLKVTEHAREGDDVYKVTTP